MNSDFYRIMLRALPARLQQLTEDVTLWVRGIWLRLTVADRGSLEAINWVIKLDECTDLELVFPQFLHWINLREVNRQRFFEMWDLCRQLEGLKDTRRWRAQRVPEQCAKLST